MSWRDRMEEASFRDFEFFTDSHQAKGGRNTAQHVYVGSEVSDSEDMGAKPWDFRLNAYFIGEDYDTQRDEFITVLNQPDPAWLTHPWFNDRFWVRATDWTIEESNDKGGHCTVTVDFIPVREDEAAAEADKVDQAEAGIEDFGDAAEEDFDLLKMSSEGLTAFIAVCQEKLEVLQDVISLSQLPLNSIYAITGMIQGAIFDIKTIMEIPGQYSNALRSLYGSIVNGAKSLKSYEKSSIVTRLTSYVGNPLPEITGPAAYEAAVRENLQREADLQDSLIVEAAAEIALDDYQVAEDRDAVLEAVDEAIENLLPRVSDEVFQAAVIMQAAVKEALQSQELSPTVVMHIAKPLPAAVLAHRLEMDEETFIARNKVRHPLFVVGRVYG